MSEELNQIIANKYRLVRRLARGGMGAVWLARHLELDVDVALKFLRAETAEDSGAEARFRREARAAAQLKSPHVVQIHDFGVHEGRPYLAMELLKGEDLDTFLEREGALPTVEAIELLSDAAKGLRVVHAQGVVHRDIKPANLFLADESGETVVKLLDFGIAKGGPSDTADATTQGLVFGSPAYMSPEQARGGVVDARSDLWSLAAVFYKMLTGVAPFQGANASDIVVKLCTQDVTPPSTLNTALGDEEDVFFRKALSRDPQERFSDVDEFIEAGRGLARLGGGRRSWATSPREIPAGRVTETAPIRAVELSVVSHGESVAISEAVPKTKNVWPRLLVPMVFLFGFALVLASYVAIRKPATSLEKTHPSETEKTYESAPHTPSLPEDRTLHSSEKPVPLRDADALDASQGDASPVVHSNETTKPEQVAPRVGPAPRAIPPPSEPASRTARPARPATDPVFGLPVEEK